MAKVVTEGSTIKCPHQGTITFTASQHKVTVDGQAVILSTDITSGVVSGCQTQVVTTPGSVSQPCKAVTSLIAGTSTSLSINGTPVLLETANGLTDGLVSNVPATWSVQSAGQDKLDAI